MDAYCLQPGFQEGTQGGRRLTGCLRRGLDDVVEATEVVADGLNEAVAPRYRQGDALSCRACGAGALECFLMIGQHRDIHRARLQPQRLDRDGRALALQSVGQQFVIEGNRQGDRCFWPRRGKGHVAAPVHGRCIRA